MHTFCVCGIIRNWHQISWKGSPPSTAHTFMQTPFVEDWITHLLPLLLCICVLLLCRFRKKKKDVMINKWVMELTRNFHITFVSLSVANALNQEENHFAWENREIFIIIHRRHCKSIVQWPSSILGLSLSRSLSASSI